MEPTLHGWLHRLEQRAPESRIELGLDRVRDVLGRLPRSMPACPVITVGGTNGKGSVVAMIESMCRAAGLRTLAYSSPHLLHFSERIRMDGEPADEASLAAAIETVEQARGAVALTYFEHVTLAALVLGAAAAPDVMVLEVGLGGRLDAVNVVDADVAVLTSIGLDHTDWLGPTRLSIGREKAGIARAGRPLIVGERRLPKGLEPILRASGAHLALAGRDFRWRRAKGGCFRIEDHDRVFTLPRPALGGAWQLANASCAVLALAALGGRLRLTPAQMGEGLLRVRLPGRLQRAMDRPAVWLDVAHNGPAARALAAALGPAAGSRASLAVFSALADKDVHAIGRALDPCFSRWLVAPLSGARARSATELADCLTDIPVAGAVETVESVADGLKLALHDAEPDGRIVVFGSFRTVAEAATLLHQRAQLRA